MQAETRTEVVNELPRMTFRPPRPEDATSMYELARRSVPECPGSRLSYVHSCRDFARTSVVALRGESLVGFALGYRKPGDPRCLVAWRTVAEDGRATEALKRAMLADMAERVRTHGVRRLEIPATLDDPSAAAIARLLAERYRARVEVSPLTDDDEPGFSGKPVVLHRFQLGD